jgi:hypothetical protein
MLEDDAVQFDQFLRENETKVNEAIKKADGRAAALTRCTGLSSRSCSIPSTVIFFFADLALAMVPLQKVGYNRRYMAEPLVAWKYRWNEGMCCM